MYYFVRSELRQLNGSATLQDAAGWLLPLYTVGTVITSWLTKIYYYRQPDVRHELLPVVALYREISRCGDKLIVDVLLII